MARKKAGGIAETARTIAYAAIVALVVRTFLFEPFNIPSGSMLPTLLVGDYLFVSKYAYGYSKHSVPFSPNLFSGRVLEQQPERGDVVVFKLPSDNRTDYIKRVIGLPGDRLMVRDGILHINGVPVTRQKINGEYEVPPGHYFVMGDNRDNSQDSRFIGPIPAENLVGRAEILFFSVDGSAALWEVWRWPTAIRWSRLFKAVE